MSLKLGLKMKRTVILLCSVLLLTGCCFNCNEYSIHNLKFPKSGNYFCPPKDYDNSYLLNDDIFDASEKCEAWKSQFWTENDPDAYERCLKRKKLFVERFHLGTCTPVLRKVKNVKKSGCLFEYAGLYNRIIKYSCYGPDIPLVIKVIETKYEIEPKTQSEFD